MSTSGAASGRSWWAINAALLLLFSFVLSSCSTGASALSPTPAPSDIKIISVLIVDENNEPIRDGIEIQVSGDPLQKDDSDDGGYYLQSCIATQFIIVVAPKYVQSSPEPCETGKTQYTIKLTRFTLGTGLDYSWVSAGSCVECHINKYTEWDLDGHSNVLVDPYFVNMYTGYDTSGRRDPQTIWDVTLSGHKVRVPTASNYGPGYVLDYPGDQGNCAYCHLPAMIRGSSINGSVESLVESFFGSPFDAQTEGITCDICHKVLDVELGSNGRPYSDKPGVLSLLYAYPPSNQQLFLGPLNTQPVFPDPNNGSSPYAASRCSQAFSEGKFCAACHYGEFSNMVIYNSYGEWLDSIYSKKEITAEGVAKKENPQYRSCQDCHMLSEQQVAGTSIAQREACSSADNSFHSFNHNMMQYAAIDSSTNGKLQSNLIKDAATLNVEYQYLADLNAIEIKTVVNNVKAGHKFPTDSPLRHLILVVDVRDEQNNLLNLVDGETKTIPLWGGVGKTVPGMENYGGMPGRIFANLLRDKDTKASPTAAYWNPTQFAWQTAEETSDTRLDPLKPEEYRYSFTIPSEGKVWINVKLVYRYAFIDLAQQKSWAWSNTPTDTSDIVVVSKSCVVDPRQDVPTACIQ